MNRLSYFALADILLAPVASLHATEVANLRCEYCEDSLDMDLALPRQLIGLNGDAFSFDFKWCDHSPDLKDPISLCLAADSAPNRRFNYRCIWKKN
jgi:hypothetical protein